MCPWFPEGMRKEVTCKGSQRSPCAQLLSDVIDMAMLPAQKHWVRNSIMSRDLKVANESPPSLRFWKKITVIQQTKILKGLRHSILSYFDHRQNYF